MTDHQWLALTAPYALGALDPGERLEFEAHLAECAMCRAEAQTFREVSELLAHAAPAALPAPRVRDRILRDARRVRHMTGRRPVLPWVVAAASVVLALVAGNAYRRGGGGTSLGADAGGGWAQPAQQAFLIGKLAGGD